jgi:glycosyltransferase involved in cell wall biosynthesis
VDRSEQFGRGKVNKVMQEPSKILYLDQEGGWGGSSRSLYYLVKGLDTSRYEPVVWHRKEGPIGKWYSAEKIRAEKNPKIVSIIPLINKNWRNILVTMPRFRHLPALLLQMKRESPDLIHYNYEGLLLVAFLFKRISKVPTVMHVRHRFPVCGIAAWVARRIAKNSDHLFFITENERNRFGELGVDLREVSHSVVYNLVDDEFRPTREKRPKGQALVILFLGNISSTKGANRLVDIGAALQKRKIPFRMIVCGKPNRLKKYLVFRNLYFEDIQSRVRSLGLSESIDFVGHVADPRDKLEEADVLIRPSVRNDPWGRDVIEALAMGVPVIATGNSECFIKDGGNGFLVADYSADAFAEKIRLLAENPHLLMKMSLCALESAERLFHGGDSVKTVESVYTRLLTRTPRKGARRRVEASA